MGQAEEAGLKQPPRCGEPLKPLNGVTLDEIYLRSVKAEVMSKLT